MPLKKYSSLHKFSLLSILGLNAPFDLPIYVVFDFNHENSSNATKALMNFNLRKANEPVVEFPDFCINNVTRWQLNISQFFSFNDYINQLKSNHKKNYYNTQKAFSDYGAAITIVDDWRPYVETVYQLYLNVAARHKVQLYDFNFFKKISGMKEYKLICIWHENKLISSLIIFDEKPVFHSMLCGFDYHHSKHVYAYSLLHYELIRLAIEAGQYNIVDVGLTADKSKSMMSFQPISSCMNIYSENYFIKNVLRLLSRCSTASINEQGKLQFQWFGQK